MNSRDQPGEPQPATSLPEDLNLLNAGYVADLYEAYRVDPTSVDAEWRARFDAGFAGLEPMATTPAPGDGNGSTQRASILTRTAPEAIDSLWPPANATSCPAPSTC